VFTKYDQFRRNISFKLEDQHRDPALLDADVESAFKEHYLASLTVAPPFVLLEKMHKPGQQCNGLIEMTANALSDGVVALMLLAVQKDHNLELSIKHAIGKATSAVERGRASTGEVIKLCIRAFPSLWIRTEGWSSREVCTYCSLALIRCHNLSLSLRSIGGIGEKTRVGSAKSGWSELFPLAGFISVSSVDPPSTFNSIISKEITN